MEDSALAPIGDATQAPPADLKDPTPPEDQNVADDEAAIEAAQTNPHDWPVPGMAKLGQDQTSR